MKTSSHQPPGKPESDKTFGRKESCL
jgi:hypothetical protein